VNLLAPDHCRRAARAGCGCHLCEAWRKALAEFRADIDADRRGEPTQPTLDLRSTR
jgi:hypothetical protein